MQIGRGELIYYVNVGFVFFNKEGRHTDQSLIFVNDVFNTCGLVTDTCSYKVPGIKGINFNYGVFNRKYGVFILFV